jgi:hypothetical protein
MLEEYVPAMQGTHGVVAPATFLWALSQSHDNKESQQRQELWCILLLILPLLPLQEYDPTLAQVQRL